MKWTAVQFWVNATTALRTAYFAGQLGRICCHWRKGILTEVTCFDLTRCTHRLACRMSGLCDTAYYMTGIHHRNIVTRLRDNDDIFCCDWLIQYLLNSGLIFSHVLKLVVFVFHLHCKATTHIISSLILHHAGPNPRYHIQTPVMITTSVNINNH